MKKIAFIAAEAIITLGTLSLSAQDKKENNYGWKEKVMSEKIGFITGRLQLTPEEAQAFWPVYNKINKQKEEAFRKQQICKLHSGQGQHHPQGKPEMFRGGSLSR